MKTGWLAVGLFVSGVAAAQAATLESVRTWGTASSENVAGIAIAGDSSIYVTGTSFGDTADVYLIKYAPDGSLEWQRTWAQTGPFINDNAGDVAVDAAGAAYVVATSLGVQGNGNDLVLLKFSPEGALLWQRSVGGPSFDTGEAVVVGADGNIYAAGETQSFGEREAFIVKFSPEGTLLWQQTWTRNGSDSAQALAIGPDGDLYVAATSFRPDFIFDSVLLRFTPDGALVSETGYAVSEIADALGLTVAADGSVYVVGSLDGAGSAFVVRFTPELALDWQRAVGGRSGDRANAVTVGPDGTLWIVGETNTADNNDEIFVVQMSADRGRVLQAHTWGGTQIDNGSDLAFGADGLLNVGGLAQAPPWTFRNSRLRSSRLRGALIELGGVLATATGVVGTPAGAVFVPAGSETFAGSSDAVLLKILP